MNTIDELRSGKLNNNKEIKISCGLTTFPQELFLLKDSLEFLDLSGNKLSSLPEEISSFKKLKIAFFSDNLFNEFPSVLSQCVQLDIIGFKSNRIKKIPENSFPKELRWLILTNNRIERIPESIGKLNRMQKLMLAGNHISFLPDEMALLKNLELLRISANKIKLLPEWLFTLPSLSWLAYSGNPCCNNDVLPEDLKEINWNDLVISKELGQGASGIINEAICKNKDVKIKNNKVAVKIFKGDVTSDGLPMDEMNANIHAGNHTSLVEVIGKLTNHPQGKPGLIMGLIPPLYFNLGLPPSFTTCTRDVFPENVKFSFEEILNILKGIASAMFHLHRKHLMHGDLYAHNILIDKNAHPILGDFGAATIYNNENLPRKYLIERIEVRAFGCLIDDLLRLVNDVAFESKEALLLSEIKEKCFLKIVAERPDFEEILSMIDNIK